MALISANTVLSYPQPKKISLDNVGTAEYRQTKLKRGRQFTDPVIAYSCIVVVTIDKQEKGLAKTRKVTFNHMSFLEEPKDFVATRLVNKVDPEKVYVGVFGGDSREFRSVDFLKEVKTELRSAGFSITMSDVMGDIYSRRISVFNSSDGPGVVIDRQPQLTDDTAGLLRAVQFFNN